jgi:hypothetical protein
MLNQGSNNNRMIGFGRADETFRVSQGLLIVAITKPLEHGVAAGLEISIPVEEVLRNECRLLQTR